MKKRKTHKKVQRKAKISNTKLMFLSIILLLIVFEALYILKGNVESLLSKSPERNVAGVSIEK